MMLAIAAGFLGCCVVMLILYIVVLHLQLRSINRQLDKRLGIQSRQPLSLELINPELNRLTANINKSLKVEENLRLDSILEEKDSRS